MEYYPHNSLIMIYLSKDLNNIINLQLKRLIIVIYIIKLPYRITILFEGGFRPN